MQVETVEPRSAGPAGPGPPTQRRHLHRLAAGFAIGTATAWRYVREAIDLLAVLADDIHACATRAARLAYAILDGTLIPIDRVANQKPYYSGKHKRHGVNVQVLAHPAGRLV